MIEELEIKPLVRTHDRKNFSCGEGRIDNYLKVNSWNDHRRYKIRIYVATRPNNESVLGFYSLTFKVWTQDDVSPETKAKFDTIGPVPAIYLAKLGVTIDSSQKGIGRNLMRHSFEQSLAVSDLAGISTLTLEAINEERAAWYERLGFKRFVPGDLRMAISLATLRSIPSTASNIPPPKSS